MVPFNISINDDMFYEGNENFMITINSSLLPTDVTVGDPGQATVTIVDDDGKQFHYHFITKLLTWYGMNLSHCGIAICTYISYM